MRIFTAAAVACLSLAGLAAGSDVQASARQNISIPAGALEPALHRLSEERDIHVVFISEDVNKLSTQGVRGELTIDEVLDRLLNGTGLTYRYIDAETVSILPVAMVPADSSASSASSLESSLWSRSRMAQGNSAAPVQGEGAQRAGEDRNASGDSSSQEGKSAKIEEIVVTAQKKGEERLKDVPIPISVLSADFLAGTNSTVLREYFTKVPGISIEPNVGGISNVSIRGVYTGGTVNPTVGITIDDTPVGSTTALGGGASAIEVDISDLARIEVLRGPQGTVYGASSLGGLLRYVTVEPSLSEVSGRLIAGMQSTENSNGLGYSLRGSLNVPLSSAIAVRASAFGRYDAGFIDDPAHNLEAANDGRAYGGRLQVLFRPSDGFSIKLGATRQHIETDASNSIDAASPLRLWNTNFLPGGAGSTRDVDFLNAAITAGFGTAKLTALTGYTRYDLQARDTPTRYAAFAAPWFGNAGPYQANVSSKKFTQEIRLDTPLRDNIDFWLGGFYAEETGRQHETLTAADNATGAPLGPIGGIFDTQYPSEYEETAAFGGITFRFTDRFDLQTGVRYSQNRQSLANTQSGTLFLPATRLTPPPVIGGPFINLPVKSKDDSFTYLITPRYKITADMMVYGRIALGYRPGMPNYNVQTTSANQTVGADETHNYEIGIKGDLIDKFLSVDASVYYIDWKDIQLVVADRNPPNLSFLANAGEAEIKGVEVSFQLRPLTGLVLDAWAAYSEANMVSFLSANFTSAWQPGARLPYSPRVSGNFSADYDFPLWSRASGRIGLSLNHVGNKLGSMAPVRTRIPAFSQLDFRAGVQSGRWDATIFVNNLTDKRGALSVSEFAGPKISIITPRTIGMTVSTSF